MTGSSGDLPAFSYHRHGRSRNTALVVSVVWAVLLAVWFWLDAAPWVVLVLGAFTLPALRDLIHNPEAGLHLDDDRLAWHSGRRHAELPIADIDHIRLDTRLDLSVRATAVLHHGTKFRLPFECTPPHQAFEDALVARGISVKRFHFQMLQ